MWIMSTPIAGVMLILTFFMREYSLERKIVRTGEANAPGDPEKGAEPAPEGEERPPPLKSLDHSSDFTPTPTLSTPEPPAANGRPAT